MRVKSSVLYIVCLILFGCTTFHEIKPIYPVVADPNRQKGVDSLQPTLRWDPTPEHDVTYDLIIYKGVKVKTQWWAGSIWSEGREVYYRQALKEPEHTVEEPLEPDTVYYWTIRTRRGEKVSEWASYDYYIWSQFGDLRMNNNHFIFKTP